MFGGKMTQFDNCAYFSFGGKKPPPVLHSLKTNMEPQNGGLVQMILLFNLVIFMFKMLIFMGVLPYKSRFSF